MGAPGTLVYDSMAGRATIASEFRELFRYRDLLRLLVLRSIKTRYKRSLLGVGWTLLNPLITMAVLSFAFSHLLGSQIPRYPVYILVGLTAWNFFSQSTAYAMGTMVWGSDLLRHVYVPRTIFAVACVGNGLVNMLFALGPLILIMLIMGQPFHATWWFLPVAVGILSIFVLGVSLLMSTLAVFFVDAVDTYTLLLQALFWLTPIIYPEEVIPDQWRWVLDCNPMYYMIDLVRRPLYHGAIPHAGTVLTACALSLLSLAVGAWYFTRKADEFQYHL